MCASCHARFDPLGMALENFNALGIFREEEKGQKINPAGELITGEEFDDIRELKSVLLNNHRDSYYRCLTEKLLTYAIGRGLDYYDEYTVDKIVKRMNKNDGRFSSLLMGVIESAPFQKQRGSSSITTRSNRDGSPAKETENESQS